MRSPELDEDEVQEQTAGTGSLVNRLAVATDAATHTPSVIQQVSVPVTVPQEQGDAPKVQSPSMFQEPLSPLDGLDLSLFEPEMDLSADEMESQTSPSHNDAVIHGFDARNESK